MKSLLFIAVITASLCVSAQDPKASKEKEQSNAERFSDKSGSLMQREFITIGEVSKCKIEVVHYKDLIDGKKISAVRFEFEAHLSYGSTTKLAVLDADEIDGFIAAIKIIQEQILPKVPDTYTEVTFKSRGGFEGGCFSEKTKWTPYLKLEKFDSNSYVFTKIEDFPKLLSIMQEAKSKL